MKFVGSKIFDLLYFCWWDGSRENRELRGVAGTSREHCRGRWVNESGASPGKTWGDSCFMTNCGSEGAKASSSLWPIYKSHSTLVTWEHSWNSRPGESWGQEEQDTEGTDLGNWKQFLYQAVVVAGACLEVHMQSIVPWQWPVPVWNKVDPHHRVTSTEYRAKIPLSTPLWGPSKLLCTHTFWRMKIGREVFWKTENLVERNFYKNKKFWTRRAGDIINWKV